MKRTGLKTNKLTSKTITALKIARREIWKIRPQIEAINLMITDKCNGRCVFCNIGRNYNGEDISFVRLPEFIIETFPDLKKVSITGGEPMLYDGIEFAYSTLKTHFPDTNTITNAMLPDRVKEFVNFNPDAKISTSLHGIGELHNQCMGIKDAWDRFHKSIQYMSGRVGAGMTVCKLNYDQITAVYDHVTSLGLHFAVNLMDISELYYQNTDLTKMLPTKGQRKVIIEQMEQIKTNQPLWKRLQMEFLTGKRRDFDCWSGRIQLFVHNSGRIYPCIYMDKAIESLQIGSLQNRSYKQINMAKCRKCLTHCEAMTSIVANTGFFLREKIRRGTIS